MSLDVNLLADGQWQVTACENGQVFEYSCPNKTEAEALCDLLEFGWKFCQNLLAG